MTDSSEVEAGKCIIFCASQRTGSTVIFDDLRNVMGCWPRNSEQLYTHIVRDKTTAPWASVWAQVCEKNHMAGYTVEKVMFHYTPYISDFIAGQTATRTRPVLEFSPSRFDAFWRFFREAIWVYVERRDVFSQAVSMFLAEETNMWEIRPGKPAPAPSRGKVPYDGVKLRAQLDKFLLERAQWQRFFAHYRIEPLRIAYEDMVADYPGYLDPLLARAGLQPKVQAPARRMLKVGNEVNDRMAESLRNEVVAELYLKSLSSG